MPGQVGKLIESVEVEKVLPVATATEKRLRFAWAQKPSDSFRMNWNQVMEPNSLFVDEVDERGIAVTVRWGLMKEPPEAIADRLNRWLDEVEQQSYRHSGLGGRHLG